MTSRRQTATIFAGLACALLATNSAWGVTPESPEVKQVIERGLKYLETASEERLGGRCLIGLSYLKNGREASHPLVQRALQVCETASAAVNDDVYSVGIAIIFLCELDAEKHRATTQKFIDFLLSKQKPNGGWGYYDFTTGDTSQTQYAALGLWMADHSGFNIPLDARERLCGWLMRTQDPSGAWGYQGADPGNLTRVVQPEVRPSLAAAGLGSLYICADLLGIADAKEARPDSGLPPALRIVEDKTNQPKKARVVSRVIDATAVRRAMSDGNNWIQQNFTVQAPQWNHYYLYGLERYFSYRELAENRVEKEPRWYNEVFNHLSKTQQAGGNWIGEPNEACVTSFAVLCLSRSSKKAILKAVPNLGDGVLLGGMGLPTNTSDLQERGGKIVATPLGGSVDELLTIIEDPTNAEASRIADAGQTLQLDSDVTKRSGQMVRLRALVSAGSFQSRQVAVRTLSKVRDLDNVPILLYALTDPDLRIVREADRGLRFISRKFTGVGLPDGEPSAQDLQKVRQAWKTWFQGIRPDAELLD